MTPDKQLAAAVFQHHCRTVILSSICYSRRMGQAEVDANWQPLLLEAAETFKGIVDRVFGNRKANPDGSINLSPEDMRLVYTGVLRHCLTMMEETP